MIVSGEQHSDSAIHIHGSILPQTPLSSRLPGNIEQSSLCHTVGPCCCSVAQSCPTLCDPMDCSMPGYRVLHYLLEFAHTHVHWVSDAIQPSHPLPPPSPSAFILSQHQGLFQWVGCSPQIARVLQHQYQSFSEYSGLMFFRIDWFDILAVQRILKTHL